jgi:alcohol dehydrogenase class IV
MLQLVGGAIGLGVLVAVYGTAFRNADLGSSHPLAGLSAAAQHQHALAHGIAAAFGFAAILDVCCLLVILALIRTRRLAPAPASARQAREETVAS